jgi:lysosomal-associated transmembrane protein
MYICCGCIHVRTGTVFLGITTLIVEAMFLLMLSCVMMRPDMMPAWMTCFVHSPSSPDETKLRPRQLGDGFGMMDDSEIGPGMMGGPRRGRGPGMMVGPGRMMDDFELVESETKTKLPSTVLPDVPMMREIPEKKPVEEDASSSDILEEMARRMKAAGMPYDINEMPMSVDEMAQHMRDNNVPFHDWKDMPMFGGRVRVTETKPGSMMNLDNDDDDDRPLIGDDSNGPRFRKFDLMDSDDKLFSFVTLVCCIVSSVLLIHGVIKGRPGYMMPFMGLQVFSFCATGLLVFTSFSYITNTKHWIAQLPDTFPWKSMLMSANPDHVMLSIVLVSVAILVVKAYLIGMVWSCYKYLTQQNTQNARRRSTDEDMTQHAEDSEMLLPPKYEDIMVVSADAVPVVVSEAGSANQPSPPPPYTVAQ